MDKRSALQDWTKRDEKLVLKKLAQYAKCGRCDRETPYPPDVLLTSEEFEKLVKAADNKRNKAMLYTRFEGALRPGPRLDIHGFSLRHGKKRGGSEEMLRSIAKGKLGDKPKEAAG